MLNLHTATEWLTGQLHGADAQFAGAAIDTRQLQPGQLFIALAGDNVDGHDFLAAAQQAGAAAALVERVQELDLPQICVPDVRIAFMQLAKRWAQQCAVPVIGVTGSNGKTGTKELLASILQTRFGAATVLATQGNLNNELGVPLTLMSLTAQHHVAVIEMGASAQGDIAQLAALAQPTIGIVTNAGPAHLAGFGGLDGVAKGKGELFAALPKAGTAIINRDDVYFADWQQRTTANVLTFGQHAGADVRAERIESTTLGSNFVLSTPQGECDINLPLVGLHNVQNALAAAAAAQAFGCDLAVIQAGLAAGRPVVGRLTPHTLANGAQLLDDAYNANPGSVKAAIDWLASVPGQRVLVLGEMAELGDNAAELHAEIGTYAKQAGIDAVLAFGPAAPAAAAFGQPAFFDLAALLAALENTLTEDTTVLVKGSRTARMERVVTALLHEEAA